MSFIPQYWSSCSEVRLSSAARGVQVEAKMTEGIAGSDAARDASERMIALGRLGRPADVGRALEFLLHPANSYITGVLSLSSWSCGIPNVRV